jgi:endoglucanase
MSSSRDAKTVELLRRLTLAPGAPGAEGAVRDVVVDALRDVPGLTVSRDRLGSVIFEKPGGAAAPRISLDAHLDEVAFMVQSITEEGNLHFVPLGGWWTHVLLAQRVDVLAERGVVPGVIGSKPPHFLSAAEQEKVMKIESLHIDVGARSREEAEGFGVRVGDPVVPHAEFLPLANPRILSAKAFDDRVGVAVMVEVLRALKDVAHPNTVIGVGAVQEEVGCRGAGTAVSLARPDACIVLEGTPADDLPGFPAATRQAQLGRGPQLRFMDPTAISNRGLVRLVQQAAADRKLPLQVAVRRSGGTDAKSIHVHGSGVPTVVLGVPARHIHTHVSLVHIDDVLAAKELVLELLRRLDAEQVARLAV